MEKRALLAILLSVAVMATYSLVIQWYTPPPVSPAHVSPAAQQAGAGPSPAETVDTEDVPTGVTGPSDQSAAGSTASEVVQAYAREEFRLVTSTQDIRLSNEGGCATWWKLTKYTIDENVAVDLIPDTARALGILPLQVQIDGDPETTRKLSKALFRHVLEDIPARDRSGVGPGRRVIFSYADESGLSIRKTLEVPDEGYLGRVSFEVKKRGKPIPATLIWASGLAQKLEDDTAGYGHVEGAAVLHDSTQVIHIAAEDASGPMQFGGAGGRDILWAGLNSTYFASLVLPLENGAPLALTIQPQQPPAEPAGSSVKHPPILTAGIRAEGGGEYRLFVGPKDFSLLSSIGYELEKVIDFSRFSLIYYCTKYLFLVLTWINSYVGNYGWSIILLTFLVRLVFFPLTYKSSIILRQTSKKMSKIQPRVKAIQDRYRKMKKSMDTQRKMNEEVMALYKKEGINPMGNLGGCLPLFLQMPVFIAFYNMLAVTIEMRHAPFGLWLQDLSRRDPYYITPLLMGGSWLAQQWMTSSSIPDPMQRRMMMFMPVMFTFFMMNMPSGLVVYWLTSNLLGMAQQYITNKKADRLDVESHGSGRGEVVPKGRRAEDGQTA